MQTHSKKRCDVYVIVFVQSSLYTINEVCVRRFAWASFMFIRIYQNTAVHRLSFSFSFDSVSTSTCDLCRCMHRTSFVWTNAVWSFACNTQFLYVFHFGFLFFSSFFSYTFNINGILYFYKYKYILFYFFFYLTHWENKSPDVIKTV